MCIADPGVPFHGRASQKQDCLWLLPEDKANCLFDIYVERIEHYQHLFYVPTVCKILSNVYDQVSKGQGVEYIHLALVLAIVACATFYWTPEDRESYQLTTQESARISTHWTEATLEMLDLSRRTGEIAITSFMLQYIRRKRLTLDFLPSLCCRSFTFSIALK